MNPNKFLKSALFAAMFLFAFAAIAETNSSSKSFPCTFEVSITNITTTPGGALLRVASDGECGYSQIDPTLFGIVWKINGVEPFAGNSNLCVAPFETSIEVTVKNIATGETAKAWFTTSGNPSQLLLIDAPSLPGFSSQDKTSDF